MKRLTLGLLLLAIVSIGWTSGWNQDQTVGKLSVDNGIYVRSYTPTVTDNMLYASGSSLFFNGTTIGSSSGVTSVTASSPLSSTGGTTPNISVDLSLYAKLVSPVFTTPNIGNATGNITGYASTVTTAAQPTITSVGTLTSLNVSGNVGINSLTPSQKLDVSGNIRTDGVLYATQALLSGTDQAIYGTTSAIDFNIYGTNTTAILGGVSSGNGFTVSNTTAQLVVDGAVYSKGTSGFFIRQPDSGCSKCGVDAAGTTWSCINVTCSGNM